MHQLLIASVFVVTMASPAIVAVRYSARPKRQYALAHRPERRRFSCAIEGSVIFPIGVPASFEARPGPRLLTPPRAIKRLPASTPDRRA